MTTSYFTRSPTTIAQAIAKSGWTLGENYDGSLHLRSQGGTFAHVQEISLDETVYLAVDSFGANVLSELVGPLDLVSEHDDDYWEHPLMENDEDEEAEG